MNTFKCSLKSAQGAQEGLLGPRISFFASLVKTRKYFIATFGNYLNRDFANFVFERTQCQPHPN